MKSNFRKVKTGFILGLLLFSILVAVVPKTSAGIIKVEPLIDVKYPTKDENLIPLSGALQIKLSTTFTITGVGGTFVEEKTLLSDSSLSIQLNVEETESWIDATIDNSQVSMKVKDGSIEKESTLKITVTEQAPAFKQGRVKISATSKAQDGILFSIKPARYEYYVSFIVGYWPVVNYLPKENFKQIGPLDTADFAIDITNLGNGYTRVACEIISKPKGEWVASIISSIKLGSSAEGGSNNKDTVYLIVKPPYGFGFHNDRGEFKVRFTPNYVGSSDNPALIGQSEIVTFNVQSVGMSPGAGFEIPLIVATLVIIGLIFYLFKKRK